MFLLLGLVLVFVVPGPWNIVALLVCVGLFFGELAFWNRKVRLQRAQVGVETVIGQVATVVTPCHPNGQVRLGGEIWEARCVEWADVADEVVVEGQEGLTLVVERTGTGSRKTGSLPA